MTTFDRANSPVLKAQPFYTSAPFAPFQALRDAFVSTDDEEIALKFIDRLAQHEIFMSETALERRFRRWFPTQSQLLFPRQTGPPHYNTDPYSAIRTNTYGKVEATPIHVLSSYVMALRVLDWLAFRQNKFLSDQTASELIPPVPQFTFKVNPWPLYHLPELITNARKSLQRFADPDIPKYAEPAQPLSRLWFQFCNQRRRRNGHIIITHFIAAALHLSLILEGYIKPLKDQQREDIPCLIDLNKYGLEDKEKPAILNGYLHAALFVGPVVLLTTSSLEKAPCLEEYMMMAIALGTRDPTAPVERLNHELMNILFDFATKPANFTDLKQMAYNIDQVLLKYEGTTPTPSDYQRTKAPRNTTSKFRRSCVINHFQNSLSTPQRLF
ncbi:hypothetical protein NMY22_g4010 [Coprinellus aureogranulatus]|nr:hypothetical protein NMY22_g4010 [Coprinellus aureogranulatus]